MTFLAIKAGMMLRIGVSAVALISLIYLSQYSLLVNLDGLSQLAVCMMPVLAVIPLPLTMPA